MPDPIKGAYFELDSVDRSAFVTSVELNKPMEILESRLFTNNYVTKEAGMGNHSFQVTFQDDSSLTITQALDTAEGLKKTFEIRSKGSGTAVSGTNPKWTGSCLVPPTVPPIVQGQLKEFTVTFEVDGEAALSTTP